MANPLQQTANRLYADHGSNPETAARLRDLIKSDADLLEHAVRMAADSAMATARHAARAVITAATPAAQAPKVFSREFRDSVEIACGRYYNWPMMDGTLLGDATRDKLLDNAGRYEAQGNACLRNGKFLRNVANHLRDGQTVREALTETQVQRIMQRAGVGS